MITLEDIKSRECKIKYDSNIDNNIRVSRHRMDSQNHYWIDTEIYEMTHRGNDPRTNESMLDIATYKYNKGIYTDGEWEKYFIPAINKMIERNDSFVRWYPGYVIKSKKYGNKCIVEYDYAFGCGRFCFGRSTDYTSLSVYELDENDNVLYSHAWVNYDDYELVDKDHTTENLEKIRIYEERHQPIW